MNPVIVYSKPACVQCDATKKRLDKHNILYVEKDIDATILHVAMERGITSAPIVDTGDDLFGGYRPDRIDALKKRRAMA